MKRTAVVTGAGSGIGAATAQRLAESGYRIVLAGRRVNRISAVADRIRATGADAVARSLDVTDQTAVNDFARELDNCEVLINNAGGAIGTEEVADADPADWRVMYETNVLGALHLTQALLPKMIAAGTGTVVFVTSTAGFTTYEGGGGYTAAKHAEHALVGTLRLELCGQPVRVIEIAPGMVHTEEFSLNRYRGDQAKATAVYDGVESPLVADDVAQAIAWTVSRPTHVNIDSLVIRPLAQAAQHKVARRSRE